MVWGQQEMLGSVRCDMEDKECCRLTGMACAIWLYCGHMVNDMVDNMVDDMVDDMVDMVDNKVDVMVDDMVDMVDNKVNDMVDDMVDMGDMVDMMVVDIAHPWQLNCACVTN